MFVAERVLKIGQLLAVLEANISINQSINWFICMAAQELD